MIYLDANVLVAAFGFDESGQHPAILSAGDERVVCTSDFVLAEFASAIARRVRTGEVDRDRAGACFGHLDAWIPGHCRIEPLSTADIRAATGYLRRLDLALRAPDALSIAAADRLGATLITLDRRMADCARVLGVAAVEP